jgi:hypothetical protein
MDYLPLIIAVAAVPAVVSVQVYALVQKMSEPEKMLQPLNEGLSADKQQIVLAHRDWLAARQLQYLTAFQFGSIQVAVFQQENAPRFFSIYFHQHVTYDLETRFDELTMLDTATSGSTGMFPARPGSYKQSFPGADAESVWQRHLEAEDYLVKKFNITWQPLTKPYVEILVNGLRLQMQHVRSIPLYPLRALYWYAVTRHRMANRSIQQQYP